MKYLLDTNAIIATINDPRAPVAIRLKSQSPEDFGISSIVLHELYYGAFKSRRLENNVELVEKLQFEVVAFDTEDAREAGRVRAELAKTGKPVGPYDVLIAGQALSRNLILVTNNTREFQRIDGLRIEDWSVAG